MTEISEKFVERQVEELSSREDVKAVAVVGSYARNPGGGHNDLDLYAIVDGSWRKRETEEVDGVVVERFFNSMEFSRQYLQQDGEWWKNYHWFTSCDARYDPESLFDDLEKEAEKAREHKMSLSEQDKGEILYCIWDFQQDLDTDDVGQKRYLMNQFFDYLVEKNYLLKGEVPVKNNYRIQKLQEFDGYMYKLAQDFLTSSSTHERQQKLEKMVDHVTKNLGDPGPEWKTDKEKFEE